MLGILLIIIDALLPYPLSVLLLFAMCAREPAFHYLSFYTNNSSLL